MQELDLQAPAMIDETLISPVRASLRLANTTNEHVMMKAERRAAEKNLENMEGNPLNHSLFYLDKNCVASSLRCIGVKAPSGAVDNLCISTFSHNNQELENDSGEEEYPVSDEEEIVEEIERSC